jgi:hypothetical protein
MRLLDHARTLDGVYGKDSRSGSSTLLPWLKNHLALGTENSIETDSPDLGGRDLISAFRGGIEGGNYFFQIDFAGHGYTGFGITLESRITFFQNWPLLFFFFHFLYRFTELSTCALVGPF